jgi:hypothetical protein
MPIEDPDSAMTLNITENLIYANDTDCGVFVNATNSDGDAQTYNIYSTFINNTIARNSGTGVCIRSEAPATIMNNILWGNVVNDLEVITSYIGPYLTNNILGHGNFPPADVPPTGELNVDPHFVAPGAGDFHLQTSSAASSTAARTSRRSTMRSSSPSPTTTTPAPAPCATRSTASTATRARRT